MRLPHERLVRILAGSDGTGRTQVATTYAPTINSLLEECARQSRGPYPHTSWIDRSAGLDHKFGDGSLAMRNPA